MADFLLDEDNDISIVAGDFKITDTTIQEVGLLLSMSKGELKSDPLVGADLLQLKKSPQSKFDVERRVRIELSRDGKDYETIKKFIQFQK